MRNLLLVGVLIGALTGSVFAAEIDGKYHVPKTIAATKINSGAASSGYVLKADGSGGASFSAPSAVALTAVTKTANYTATTSDGIIRCDATGGTFQITLPAAASSSGTTLYVKKVDSSANAVTIKGNSSELIDLANTFLLVNPGDTLQIYCNGTNWDIL